MRTVRHAGRLVACGAMGYILLGQAAEGAGAAREAVVKAYDANGDGKLDCKEEAVVINKFDANGNGKLDKDEKKAVVESVTAKQVAGERASDRQEDDGPPARDRAERLPYPPLKYTIKDWVPVKRTTEKLILAEEDVIQDGENAWQLKFYRNKACKCGLSGNYTFVVIEPKTTAGKEAPLWVYFHGGGSGRFDKDGEYITVKFQDEDAYNHEESFETLRRVNDGNPVFENGRFVDADTTLTRRVKEGYRLLVIGYGDHDQYSGKGTPYPNNPKDGEVNGLQASMSAVEYTAAPKRIGNGRAREQGEVAGNVPGSDREGGRDDRPRVSLSTTMWMRSYAR